jgi:hypothetical protein
MQKARLSITLQQFKMKVAKITQTRPTLFQNGVQRDTWWFWFKKGHPKISINLIKRREVFRAKTLTTQGYHTFYYNLENSYT